MSYTTIGPSLQLVDFDNASAQKINNWFKNATLQLYGPAFQTWASVITVTTAGVYNQIKYGQLEYHTGCYRTDTWRFITPQAGLYHFDVSMIPNGTPVPGEALRLALYVNGAIAAENIQTQIGAGTNEYTSLQLSTSFLLKPNDYVEAYFYNSTTASLNVAADQYRCRFSGHLIRPL